MEYDLIIKNGKIILTAKKSKYIDEKEKKNTIKVDRILKISE